MIRWMMTALLAGLLHLPVPAAAAPVTIDVTGGDVRAVLLAVARMGDDSACDRGGRGGAAPRCRRARHSD